MINRRSADEVNKVLEERKGPPLTRRPPAYPKQQKNKERFLQECMDRA